VYLAHTGRVGGGRKGIGQRTFLEFYRAPHQVYVPERNATMILLGQVDRADFAKDLSAFVHAVANFKAQFAR